jgi:hypothetical protein
MRATPLLPIHLEAQLLKEHVNFLSQELSTLKARLASADSQLQDSQAEVKRLKALEFGPAACQKLKAENSGLFKSQRELLDTLSQKDQ